MAHGQCFCEHSFLVEHTQKAAAPTREKQGSPASWGTRAISGWHLTDCLLCLLPPVAWASPGYADASAFPLRTTSFLLKVSQLRHKIHGPPTCNQPHIQFMIKKPQGVYAAVLGLAVKKVVEKVENRATPGPPLLCVAVCKQGWESGFPGVGKISPS